MTTAILGTHDIATLRPLWGKGAALRLWAKDGLVCYEMDGDGKFGTMRWQDAARRVLALSQMVAKKVEGGFASERQQIQRFISRMEIVIRNAKEQGGPDDFEAIIERSQKRRKARVIVPQIVDLEL